MPTDPVEAQPWDPVRSSCCNARAVYYYPPADRYIVYYPWHGPVRQLFCGRCNLLMGRAS